MIACAYLVYQAAHRPPLAEAVKAILLAAAFFFWAANQFWPALPPSDSLQRHCYRALCSRCISGGDWLARRLS